MPQNGDIRIFDGFRYIWMEEEGLWNPIGQVLEPPPPDEVQSDTVYTASAVREYRLERLELDELHAAVGVRMKQPSYIYCTVVANKIRYKHKVYSNDSLTDGSLNGRRFYFKYYPPPHHPDDSMMELVSTEAVHKGRLRELPATLMQKFWLENRALLYDERRDTRMYQYWLPTDKKGKSKMYVDEVEPITLTYPADSDVSVTSASVVEDDYLPATDEHGGHLVDASVAPPRRLTPAEEARETDAPARTHPVLEADRNYGRDRVLQDHTALFDADRTQLERWGIDTRHIVGSTEHYWLMADGSVVDKRTGDIITTMYTTPEPGEATPTASPVTRSTMLPDGTQLPDVDRVAMEEAGINASAILGSTHAFWVGRNFLINRDTRRIEAASPSLEGNIADLLRSRGVNV